MRIENGDSARVLLAETSAQWRHQDNLLWSRMQFVSAAQGAILAGAIIISTSGSFDEAGANRALAILVLSLGAALVFSLGLISLVDFHDRNKLAHHVRSLVRAQAESVETNYGESTVRLSDLENEILPLRPLLSSWIPFGALTSPYVLYLIADVVFIWLIASGVV